MASSADETEPEDPVQTETEDELEEEAEEGEEEQVQAALPLPPPPAWPPVAPAQAGTMAHFSLSKVPSDLINFVQQTERIFGQFAQGDLLPAVTQVAAARTPLVFLTSLQHDHSVVAVYGLEMFSAALGATDPLDGHLLALAGDKGADQTPTTLSAPRDTRLLALFSPAQCRVATWAATLLAMAGVGAQGEALFAVPAVGASERISVGKLCYLPECLFPYFQVPLHPKQAIQAYVRCMQHQPAAVRAAFLPIAGWLRAAATRESNQGEGRARTPVSFPWIVGALNPRLQRWAHGRFRDLVPPAPVIPLPEARANADQPEWMAQFGTVMGLALQNLPGIVGTAHGGTAHGGPPPSKLSISSLQLVGRACGMGRVESLEDLPPAWEAMITEGFSVAAIKRVLRSNIQAFSDPMLPPRIHVHDRLCRDIKDLEFGSLDFSWATAASGITPFAVPAFSMTERYEIDKDDDAWSKATLLAPKDITGRKNHLAPAPKDLPALKQWLRNYAVLLEILFGVHCPHLVQVVELFDAVSNDDSTLEGWDWEDLATVLWTLHREARRFFAAACTGPDGSAPKSTLTLLVHQIQAGAKPLRVVRTPFSSLCPRLAAATSMGDKKRQFTTAFLSPATSSINAKHVGSGISNVNGQFHRDLQTALAPAQAVKPGVKLWELCRASGAKYTDIRVGNRRACHHFMLMGECPNPNCSYEHISTPPEAIRPGLVKRLTQLVDAFVQKGPEGPTDTA